MNSASLENYACFTTVALPGAPPVLTKDEDLQLLLEAIWAMYPRPSHASVHANGRWFRFEWKGSELQLIEVPAPNPV